MRFNFHLPHSNLHLPLKSFMFYNVHLKPNRTWCWHVKAYFLGQAWMPDHKTCTHSQKQTRNIHSILAQWGKQDTVFTCPTAVIYKFYLPGATGQAPMSSPDIYIKNQTAHQRQLPAKTIILQAQN